MKKPEDKSVEKKIEDGIVKLLNNKESLLKIKEEIIENIKTEHMLKEKNNPDLMLMDKIKLLKSVMESTYGGEMFLVERYNVPKIFDDEIDIGRLKSKMFELINQL